jgi:methionine-rich copper-binding protein CopC
MTALLLPASVSYGQAGTFLGQVTFATDCGYTSSTGHRDGVGITFDGTNMWYSCYDSMNSDDSQHRDLFKANPKTGAVLGAWDIEGGMGAIAYDATRNVIWAGEGGGLNAEWIIEIPLDTNKNASNGGYSLAFQVPEAYSSPPATEDIVDGLAIDATTGTLYVHYDFATEFEMYGTNSGNFGAFLGYIQQAPDLAKGTPILTPHPPATACVLSGLAVGGSEIFEASDYCDAVWAVDKSSPLTEEKNNSFVFASSVPSAFDEKAITCDTATFSGFDAIWVKDVFTPTAYAFELLAGTCGVGGEPASSTPSASLSPTSLTFASQSVGTTSSAQTVTLTNSGGGALSISSIAVTGTNSGDFAQTHSCGSSLAAGASCSINVTFTPTAVGTRTATLTVTDNASGSPQTASLTGTGTSAGASLSPTSLTFAGQQVGTTSSAQPLTLSSTGSTSLNITSITVSSNYGQTNNCGSSVAAGSKCTINVTFAPTSPGTLNGSLAVSDNASGSPQTASLTGTGLGPGVTLSPASLTFISQYIGTTSAPQTVTLTNSGNQALVISSVAITGTNLTDFGQTNTCPLSPSTLAAGASCTVSVTFSPTASGTRTASLTFTDNAFNSPQSAGLSGTGTTPPATLSPSSVTFGNQLLGTSSPPQAVTLTNNVGKKLNISSIAFTGANSGDFKQTNNCGSSIAGHSSCIINVTFTPSAAGTRTATLTATDNAANSPQTASLAGTGTTATVSLAPASVSFGNQQVGTTSGAQALTLSNSTSSTLTISSIAFTGTNSGDFSQTNTCGSSLAAGSSCTISVTFTPAATGARTATLAVTDNASGSPQTASLSGTGTAPAATLSPTSLTFSSQNVGTTSAPQAVTLSNSGSAALSISSIAVTGTNSGDFAQSNNCGSSLAASSSCTINVTFTPTATGSRSATLTVTDNASGSPQTASLSGTGTSSSVNLSPSSLAFGNQQVGMTSAPQVLTLSNSGSVATVITSIAVTGTNSADFAQTNNCGSLLAASSSCTINVTFTPTATGSRAATLTVTDDAANSPQTASLSGTGTAPAAALSPASLTFSSQNVGTTSAAQTVALTNSGGAALSISSIAVTGTNSGDFAQSNNCGSSLAASSSCTINITFTPTTTGSRSATLTVTDNASGSPQTASLSGTGSVASSGPTVVQVQNNVDPIATNFYTSFTLNISTTPGDLLVGFVRESSNGTDNFTITDSAGQTWTQTASGYSNETSTGPRSGMFYMANSAAVSSVTVNFTTSGGVIKPGIMVMEISGAALTGVADGSVNNKSGASVTASTSGPLSTTNASDILIFASEAAGNESGWTAGAGYAIPNNLLVTGASGSNIRMAMQFAVVSSTQAGVTTSMTYANANWNSNIFAAFK